MGILLALLSAAFFGIGNTAVAKANLHGDINNNEGLLITLIINNLLNLFLLPFIFLLTNVPAVNWSGILSFVATGFFSSFLGRLLLISSIGLIGASRAGTIKMTAPVFTVILGVWVLKENLTIINMIGIAVVLSGVALVSLETQKSLLTDEGQQMASNGDEEKVEKKGLSRHINLGLPLGFLAGFSLGASNVLRKVGVTYYANPLIGAVVSSLVSLVCTLLLFKLFRKSFPLNMTKIFHRQGSKGYIYFGVMTSLAIYFIFFSLLYLPVSIVNTITSLEALFTIISAWILLKRREFVTTKLFVGTIVVICGVILIV